MFSPSILMPEHPSLIHSDRQRLEQILRNLVANGIKFTDKGMVTVAIRPLTSEDREAVPSLGDEGGIAIAVTDTGIGIPPEKQKVVFEAFQQADGSTSRKYGGTGLGLSISRELAGLLGGEIHLASTPGEGATFTLFLPLVAPRAEKSNTAGGQAVAAAPRSAPPPPPNLRRAFLRCKSMMTGSLSTKVTKRS